MTKEPERSVEATLIPLTAADVREHCRINATDEDSLIESYIQSARTYFEDVYNLTFLTTTWKMYWESFETPLIIPRPPYVSVTTLTYVNENGVVTALTENTDYAVDNKSTFAEIKPYESLSWPSDVEDDLYNAVVLTYVAGYTTVAKLPQTWVQALRLMVEIMADRYGPLETAAGARFLTPFNAIDTLIGAYSVPKI